MEISGYKTDLINYKDHNAFDKTKSIYDLIHYGNEKKEVIELVMLGILKNTNELLSAKLQLNDKQMIFIIQEVIESRNSITIKHFAEAIKRGLMGEFGTVFRFDITTIIPWIDAFYHANYDTYVENEKQKRERDSIQNAASGDMAELLKEALKRSEKPSKITFQDPEYKHFKSNYDIEHAKKDPGYLVETRDGKTGRTYNSKEVVNGKIPVYLCTEFDEDRPELKIPVAFAEQPILCDPKSLKRTGFIDY